MLNKQNFHVIGIDPSLSGTGVIVLDSTGQIVHREVIGVNSLGSKVADRMKRFSLLLSPVQKTIERFKPVMACIEGYSLGSNMPGVSDRVEYGGLLRWSLVAAGVPLFEVAPLTLKKWATGIGKGDKTPVIASITKMYGHMFSSDNEYDAFALATMAFQILKGEGSFKNQAQRESISTVVNGSAKQQKKRTRKS